MERPCRQRTTASAPQDGPRTASPAQDDDPAGAASTPSAPRYTEYVCVLWPAPSLQLVPPGIARLHRQSLAGVASSLQDPPPLPPKSQPGSLAHPSCPRATSDPAQSSQASRRAGATRWQHQHQHQHQHFWQPPTPNPPSCLPKLCSSSVDSVPIPSSYRPCG